MHLTPTPGSNNFSFPTAGTYPVPRLSPARAALILDVREAVAGLPPDLKPVAVALMHADTQAEAARRAGRTPQQFRAGRDELARHLRPLDPRARRPNPGAAA